MRHLSFFAAFTATAICLTGCANGEAAPAGSSSPATEASSAPAQPTPAQSPPPPAQRKTQPVKVRTAAALKKALLERSDLPKGFAVQPDNGGEDDVKLSTTKDSCAALLKLVNGDQVPGARTVVKRTLVYNQNLPVITHELDAMGSTEAVAAAQKKLKSAVSSCENAKLTAPGQASSPVTIKPTTLPGVSKDVFAARFTATGGPLNGLTITFVTAPVEDVLIAISFVGAVQADVAGGTILAAGKLKKSLGA